jgi:hypothetical protein
VLPTCARKLNALRAKASAENHKAKTHVQLEPLKVKRVGTASLSVGVTISRIAVTKAKKRSLSIHFDLIFFVATTLVGMCLGGGIGTLTASVFDTFVGAGARKIRAASLPVLNKTFAPTQQNAEKQIRGG